MAVQLVVASGNRTGQVIPISIEKFIIGRAADCHLQPKSELISRYHCVILVGEEIVVRDLGSRNGVRLNGERITAEQKLANGDKLAVGPLEFFVNISADAPCDVTGENVWHLSHAGNELGASPLEPTVLHNTMEPLGQETK